MKFNFTFQANNLFEDVTLDSLGTVMSICHYFLTLYWPNSSKKKKCSAYLSVHSSGLETIVIAAERGHNCFYGWACCEWSKYKGDQKDFVSFITHFKRGRKRRRLTVKAAIARCIVTVAQTHFLTWRKTRPKRKKVSSREISQLMVKYRLRDLHEQEVWGVEERQNRREFIWIEVKGHTAINHGPSWGLNSLF